MLGFILEHRVAIQHILIGLLCLAAWRWGAGPERAIAGAFAYFVVADALYHAVFGPGVELGHTDIGHLINDLVAGVIMIGTALYANRMYTLWIGALQLIAILAHVTRDLGATISPLTYAVMFIAPSYFQLMLLAGGIIAHHRRTKRYGTYRSWRTSSLHSPVTDPRNYPGV